MFFFTSFNFWSMCLCFMQLWNATSLLSLGDRQTFDLPTQAGGESVGLIVLEENEEATMTKKNGFVPCH